MHAIGDMPDGDFSHGHTGPDDCHIRRLTSPCSLLTPLLEEAMRKARPSCRTARSRPRVAPAQARKSLRLRPRPAG